MEFAFRFFMELQPKFHHTADFRYFWEKGNGKELIDMSGANVSLESFDRFAPLYYKVDTAGDLAAEELLDAYRFPEVFRQISRLTEAGPGSETGKQKAVTDLWNQMTATPDWVDEDLLNAGAELCMRASLNALIVLRDFTLMGGYDFAYLNKPLIFTGALKKGAVKRLTDTLNFWVNVTRTNALMPGEKGFGLCFKTRLMHSVARLMILEKMPGWRSDLWGKPINQWDMIATYTGFSLMFLSGLKKMGMKVSEREEEGLFHLWKYIGHLIGIPAEYMPVNAKEATEGFYLWTTIQPSADEDSVLLAHALLDESLESEIYKHMHLRRRLRYLHICCSHFLLDDGLIERLQIPEAKFKMLFPNFLLARNRVFQLLPVEKQISLGDKAQQKVLLDYLKHAPE